MSDRSELVNQNRAKERYKVNLSEQMACCEVNYVRLLKLMPNLLQQTQWRYQVAIGDTSLDFSIDITEQAPYTTMLDITQVGLKTEALDLTPVLQVRMYHDVKMAEVMSWCGHRSIRARYDYPNKQMYQQDEKAQFNKYLADSLDSALQHGRMADMVSIKI
jgi:uncharacterized protein YqiB (DUF1249 family)